MAATLKLEIVTPEGKACSEEVEMVTLPGIEGEMGIFPNHVPLLTEIVPGEIVVRREGADYFLAVGPGFAEITGDHVAILTDMAVRAEDADEAQCAEAVKAAENRLRERLGDEDAVAVNAAIARSIEQMRGRRRRR
jgi:F-type H+-transporting ATPase subunit epsilon